MKPSHERQKPSHERQKPSHERQLPSETLRKVLPYAAGVFGLVLVWALIRRTAVDRRVDHVLDALEALPLNPRELTIGAHGARYLAERLYIAMDRNGTDEEAITDALMQLKTRADLVAVIKAFGVRMYGMSGGNSSWIGKVIGWSTPLDLSGWFRRELSGASLRHVEKVYLTLGMQL